MDSMLLDFERRVDRTVKGYGLLPATGRIGVALSGDDSYAVLLYLHKRVPPERLVAITVQESSETSRPEEVAICQGIAAELGIEHHLVTFPQLFGATLEGMERERAARAPSFPICALCIGLRNDALTWAGTDLGVSVLVDGYNADDWAGNLLRNFLFGTSATLSSEPASELVLAVKRKEGQLTKVSPLSFMRKRETQANADAHHPANFPAYRCEHLSSLQGNSIGKVLRLVDELWPDSIPGIVGRNLEPVGERDACSRCGLLPAPNRVTKLCRVCWANEHLSTNSLAVKDR